MSTVKRLLLLAPVVLLLLSGSASAETSAKPWWHLLSVARPTNIEPGSAESEVQELTVTPGTLFELAVKKVPVGVFTAMPTAAELRADLEGGTAYGPGNVEVSGAPPATGSGTLAAGSTEVTEVDTESGAFEVGQPISGHGILALTTIVAVDNQTHTLTLSQAAIEPGAAVPLVAGITSFRIMSVNGGAGRAVPALEVPLKITGAAEATVLTEGKPDGEIIITAANVGNATVNGETSPVQIKDVLPANLEAVSITGGVPEGGGGYPGVPIECTLQELSCTVEGSYENGLHQVLAKSVPPFDQVTIHVGVVVTGPASGEENHVSITGGGAPSTSAEHPVASASTPAPFGVEDYELLNEQFGGASDTQAGSHPFQQTTTIALNTSAATVRHAQESALAKDLSFLWPAGLIGDPVPFERCTLAQFFSKSCPPDSIVGVTSTIVDEPTGVGIVDAVVPLYNVEPAPGQAARFGFLPSNVPVFIGASVRTGADYGITVHVENIAQFITYLSSQVTVWGVPGDPSHDISRGEGCLREARGETPQKIAEEGYAPCRPFEKVAPPPFLTLPSACTGALQSTVDGDSWVHPDPPGSEPELAASPMPALDGCDRLPFTPSIVVTPDGTAGSTPTGLTVDEHVPQQATLNAAGLAEADVKGLSVTLPEGVAINPSAGDGLLSCSEAQIGLRSPEVTACPEDAKVATVHVKVPVLEHELVGAAYIATQNANPFGSLMAMYIYAEDPVSGVRIKSAGQVLEDPATGQLTAHFEEDPAFKGQPETSRFLPQAPFEDVVLHFFGGERAPLATPARCGSYTTTGTFTPWSAQPFDEAALIAHAQSTFNITSGPHGGPCPGPALPFAPTFTSGTTNINAGGFSDLTTTIGRQDGQQNLQSVVLHYPPGVSGMLKGVPLCPEARANEGSCGPESLIGETTVSAGVGAEPVAVTGGKVYLTEKYAGAPFGLSIVNPVKAGPFDLEHDTSNPANAPSCDCVVVRARIDVNPITAALTVTTDPSGPHAIPHIIDGIPVQIKAVNVLVNRPGFTFNPTSCDPMSVTGAIGSDEGASQLLQERFQVTNCSALKFQPKVAVATAGKASKTNGASLSFKISYPQGAQGADSWFSEAKFTLPKQLPARLTTIQQACLAATFEANEANCPAASRIGHAVVHTPVLPVPLEGPVYFVSYGGAKFPEAVLVLKGYGITVDLHGETFIDGKTGVTSATFKSTPDVPFESIEVSIPTGPFSEFGANLPAKDNYNLCGQKLVMPTLFKAQNGLEINQNTPISVTGCPKALTRAQKLAAALKACHHKRGKKRSTCEKAARKKYRAKTPNTSRKHSI